MKILIINGANINLIGEREPAIYGSQSFTDYYAYLKKEFSHVKIDHFQTNLEGEIVNKLQAASGAYDWILLNPGGYTHTSVSIADAVAACKTPVMEVHVTYPASREPERRGSLISAYCKGTIEGLGLESYRLALEHVIGET